jgi:hypothetical protein
MADEETPTDDKAHDDDEKEGLGDKLHHAEHRVEEAFKDTVARVENRVILAGEAETSASPEVNLASALEVAINPPEAPDEAEAEKPENAIESPKDATASPKDATEPPKAAPTEPGTAEPPEGAEGPAKA